MKINYVPRGVCSRQMTVEAENGISTNVQVVGGCDGNLKGIMSLLIGMEVDQASARMEGIRGGMKSTSCPDQLANALKCLKQESN